MGREVTRCTDLGLVLAPILRWSVLATPHVPVTCRVNFLVHSQGAGVRIPLGRDVLLGLRCLLGS